MSGNEQSNPNFHTKIFTKFAQKSYDNSTNHAMSALGAIQTIKT